MRKKAILVLASTLGPFGLAAGRGQGPDQPPPAAHSRPAQATRPAEDGRPLYDRMVAALRQARTLYWESEYTWEARGRILGHADYAIWLEKPNFFRLEARSRQGENRGGVLVGDGERLWLYWLGDRPYFSTEDREEWEKTRQKVYMTQPAPLARHSIAHQTGYLGAGMSMTILDPSTFHGYTDSLQAYLDGVVRLGEEQVDGRACDVVEASLMKGQRLWRLWLDREDHLPRRLLQTIHVSHDIVTRERWRQVKIDGEIQAEKFQWRPPEGWQSWQLPSPESRLLKAGEAAPGFALKAADGHVVRLSDFKGKVVWLYIWRAG